MENKFNEIIFHAMMTDKAKDFVDETLPKVCKTLDRHGKPYDEEVLREIMTTGFSEGFASCLDEIKGKS